MSKAMITPVGPVELIAFAAILGTDAEIAARKALALSAMSRGLQELFHAICSLSSTPKEWKGVNYWHLDYIRQCHQQGLAFIDEAYEFMEERCLRMTRTEAGLLDLTGERPVDLREAVQLLDDVAQFLYNKRNRGEPLDSCECCGKKNSMLVALAHLEGRIRTAVGRP